jgi:serine phosphatase RsbU (regulator of sigma subunit)
VRWVHRAEAARRCASGREARLADFISAAAAAGDPAPETVRRLMRHVLHHRADQLQDDASIVILEWLTGTERQFQL